MIEQFYESFKRWAEIGTVWVISDTHFGDKQLKSGLNRPTDDELVALINSKVGKKDTLLILGDVGNTSYVEKLKGYKILVMGNHDSGVTNYKKSETNKLFDEVYEGPVIVGEKLILSHEPINVDWAFNIHGHVHDVKHKNDSHHFNVCSDVVGYVPINLNQLVKTGIFKNVQTIHRTTINVATERKKRRNNK